MPPGSADLQAARGSGTCSIQWVVNKNFLRLKFTLNYPDGKSVEFLELVGASKSKERLRRWVFDPSGTPVESSSVEFENAIPGEYRIEWLTKTEDDAKMRDFVLLSGDQLFLYYGCKDTDTKKATRHEANISIRLVRSANSK